MIKQIKSFVGKNLLTKEWLDNPDLTKARLEKCKSCVNYDTNNDTCKICTCIIEIKSKAKVNWNPYKFSLEETHCPVGKWPVLLDDGSIGENDKHITNHYREQYGKNKLV